MTGAASLWLMFLYYRKNKAREISEVQNLEKLSDLLVILFSAGLIIFTVSWAILKYFFYAAVSSGHEGIIVKAAADYIRDGLNATSWFVVLLMIVGGILIYTFKYRKSLFYQYRIFLFSASFLLVSLIDVFILYVGSLDKLQFFYFLHHWHSIFTVGTVITVDYLYFKTSKDINLKRTAYNIFPFLSAIIWTGLGLDFLSNVLIFKQAFLVNSQFIFIQTVIAIIILNGALLADKINKRLIDSVRTDNPRPITPEEDIFLSLSGSVSIISWLTIAFVDLFVFDLKYWQFIIYYLLVIIIAFIFHRLVIKNLLKEN